MGQIVVLPVAAPLASSSHEPPSRLERLQDRLALARAWVSGRTVRRSPVVVIRRRELRRREMNAFELGRHWGDVIVLPLTSSPHEPPSRLERLQDRLALARAWVSGRTVRRSPVVVVRRSELRRRERDEFELGRDCARYLGS